MMPFILQEDWLPILKMEQERNNLMLLIYYCYSLLLAWTIPGFLMHNTRQRIPISIKEKRGATLKQPWLNACTELFT